MLHKREAINVLLSKEVNDGLQTLASNLGVSKSKVVRLVCVLFAKTKPITRRLHEHSSAPLMKTNPRNIRFDEHVLEDAKLYQQQHNMSFSCLVRVALLTFLKRKLYGVNDEW